MPHSLKSKVKSLCYKGEITEKERDRIIQALEQQPCEDCISRKEALRHRHIIYDDDGVGYSVVRVDEIEQLPSVTPQQARWIPVSERLPETDGVYTVTRRLFDKQVDTEPYSITDACYFDGSNTWHNDNRINHSRPILEDIIAWMPLPKPYKAESEERTNGSIFGR